MKILIVHQYYLLPGQPGGSRFNEMARLWRAAGHEVTVIAGSLDYATSTVPERYRGRLFVKEQDAGVTIYRCHVPQSYGKSYLGRMWAFLGFTISSTIAAGFSQRPDVVIATSPPLITVIPGAIAATCKGRRIPWVFEVRDLWPESAVSTGVLAPRSALTKLLYALERWACRYSSRINVLTPAFQADMVRRGLATESKFCLVPNGADLDSFRPATRDNSARVDLGWGERFVVMYAGAHGRANDLLQLVDAASELTDRPDILIACVGDGPERQSLAEEVARRKLTNIRFYGVRPKSSMPDIVNACDVGAAVLQDNPTFRTVYPNKVFDYMACARPILLAIDGAARRLVCEQAQAGVFAEPGNGSAIASKIRVLADDHLKCRQLGENGRSWVLQNASREVLAARYLDILNELTGT